MKIKKRLDIHLVEKFPSLSRNQIQSFIMQGKVHVNGTVISKPGTSVCEDDEVLLDHEEPKYVSRGGFKLEAALKNFQVDVTGFVVLDAGISTGGFTDCLLQHGAKKVYGIDVGYGQVHEKLLTNPAVVVIEKTNLRHLDHLPELVDLATLDLSFISILKILPALIKLLKPEGRIVALIKPQFEAERGDIRRGGLVIDEKIHQKVIEKIQKGMAEFGFAMKGIMESPIRGAASGNKEFLGYFVKS